MLCGLLLIALAVVIDVQATPVLPAQFTTSFDLRIYGSNLGPGWMQFSKDLKGMYTNNTQVVQYLNQSLVFEQVYTETAIYVSFNDVCRPVEGTFYDIFGWLVGASFVGNETINDRRCQLWKLDTSHTNFSVCIDAASRPVRYRIDLDHYPNDQIYDFGLDFAAASVVDKSLFVPAQDCLHAAPTCHDRTDNATEALLAYIFHPENTTGDIGNQDVADELGDTVFICSDVLDNHTDFDSYALVSLYNLTVVTNWAQYQQCNEYPGVCLGYGGPGVGREASYGVYPNAGQCSNNTEVGNWYSLPKQGHCQQGDTMGLAYNCTWIIEERIKTIDATCLLKQHGMEASCRAERMVPFTATRAILRKAFESDDVTQGGCPNVVPHV
eukprot:m.141676 g.141676  ORF g.141676 m.141676 type:complete len:382 (+) comp16135_c0_seq1:1088-2233(+)